MSAAIVRHNVGTDWHATLDLLSVSIKDFTLNCNQQLDPLQELHKHLFIKKKIIRLLYLFSAKKFVCLGFVVSHHPRKYFNSKLFQSSVYTLSEEEISQQLATHPNL